MNHNIINKIFDKIFDKLAIMQWKDKIKELNKEYHETFMDQSEKHQGGLIYFPGGIIYQGMRGIINFKFEDKHKIICHGYNWRYLRTMPYHKIFNPFYILRCSNNGNYWTTSNIYIGKYYMYSSGMNSIDGYKNTIDKNFNNIYSWY